MQDVGREMHHEVKQKGGCQKVDDSNRENHTLFTTTTKMTKSAGTVKKMKIRETVQRRKSMQQRMTNVAVRDQQPYPTETDKRRERRHAQAAREREGERRRKAGLPRNYLLIDEHT